jgi:hypothetical protein
LPLAVLIGYFLAEPMESGSIAVVILVMAVLSVPLLMKWYHPLLLLSWNATITPFFIPGRPVLWMIMGLIGLFFAVLNRSVSANRPFINVPAITRSLIFLAVVVAGTAFLTGGIGIRSLGSNHYGGRGYFFMFSAIASYFAFTSQRIPLHRAASALKMYFLPGITAMIPNVAYLAGPGAYFLFSFFPVEEASGQAAADNALGPTIMRLGGAAGASIAVYSYLLARYGVRGTLDLSRPWRLLLFLLATLGCVIGGYRGVILLFGLTFAVTFWLEGLWRTRFLPILGGAVLLVGTIAFAQADKLPWSIQRAISFLPVQIDPLVKSNAEGSTKWRVEMWKMVLPQIPKYLFKGKGYALDPGDIYLAQQSAGRGLDATGESGSALVGDYHNGPLSVIIPFGIYGMIGFLWFLGAGIQVLVSNYRFGDPALRYVNTFFLSTFVAKAIFFFLIFGSIAYDLAFFAGLLGLAVSINGKPRTAAGVPEQMPEEEYAFSQT